MKTFNPIKRNNVAPVDIDAFGNAYRELEQGHQKAVQFESALKTAMAQIDLNEDEDGWREEKINNIRATLSENTRWGNAAGAVDDLVRAQGDIFSDPALLGRVRNQQEYKNYLDNLNKRTDISEDYKNYYRANTKYYHKDIINPETGKVIGSSKWEPQERPVSSVDFYKVMSEAANNASPDMFGGDKVQFLDVATGKISNTATPGAQWVQYNKLTQKVVKLPPAKIQAAIDAYIKANPEVKASLEQDFKIDKWKHERNPEIFTDAYDDKGNLKTFNAYVQSKIDPFIVGKQRNEYHSSIEYNNAALNMLTKEYVKNTNSGGDSSTSTYGITSSPSIGSAKYRVTQAPTFEGLYNARNASLAANQAIKSKYPDIDISFDATTTEDDVKTMIVEKGIQGDAAFDIWSTYKNFKDATLGERLLNNQINTNVASAEDIAAFEFKRQLDSGIIEPVKESDSPELKRFKLAYADFRNNIIGDAAGVGVYLKDNRQLDYFMSQFGADNFEVLGIRTKQINGRIAVIMPATGTDKLISFIKAGHYATSNDRGFRAFMNSAFGGTTGSMFKTDANNNIIGEVSFKEPFGNRTTGAKDATMGISDVWSLDSYADQFTKNLDKQVGNIQQFNEKVVDTTRKGVGSPYEMLMYDMYQNSIVSEERKVYNDNITKDKAYWENVYRGNYSLPSATNLLVLDPDTNEYRPVDKKDREFFRNAQTGKYEDTLFAGSLERFPNIGYRHTVNVRYGDEIKRFAVIDGIGDKHLEQLNNSIPEKALQNVEKLYNHFQPIQFVGPDGMMAIVKDLETNTVDLYNDKEQLMARNLDPSVIQAASEWAVAYDKFRHNQVDQSNIGDVQRSYAKFLASIGYNNEMIAEVFNNTF